jgi:hypothetical protein
LAKNSKEQQMLEMMRRGLKKTKTQRNSAREERRQ